MLSTSGLSASEPGQPVCPVMATQCFCSEVVMGSSTRAQPLLCVRARRCAKAGALPAPPLHAFPMHESQHVTESQIWIWAWAESSFWRHRRRFQGDALLLCSKCLDVLGAGLGWRLQTLPSALLLSAVLISGVRVPGSRDSPPSEQHHVCSQQPCLSWKGHSSST